MTRKLAWAVYLPLVTLLLLLGRTLTTQAAPSATAICGNINLNDTWTVAGSPYQVCPGGATIAAGVTVNIQPGVTVEVANGGILTSRGTLTALGTAAQPITFTGAVASPGSWQGLSLESVLITPTHAILDHAVFRYGGVNATSGSQIFADNAVVTVTNSLLRDGAGSGIYATGELSLTVHDTQILNNGRDAIFLAQSEAHFNLGGLTATGNNRNVVVVQSSFYAPGAFLWTNAGIPYLINSVLGNAQGDTLTIEPGAELRFLNNSYMNIRGDLLAIGLPTAPITLTGNVATPGYWGGLVLYGLTRPATAELDYVTVEYGGEGISTGANIYVQYGSLVARHVIDRFSSKDGVRINSGSTASILNSQILGNQQYGVRNLNVFPTRFVLATNNWWGHPSGPTPDTVACGNGQGDKVTDGVLFKPVLTSTVPIAFPLTDAPSLMITPRRWFAPADNQTKVFFDIVLRDADGFPLPGRTVNITSSPVGTATSGGITDSNGHTLAYVVSNNPGTAVVTAVLSNSGCESAMSPSTSVTFNPPVNVVSLFPNAQAPYFDSGISLSPMPVIVGVSTTLSARLTNPLTVPVTVDVEFGYVQSSIGLAFGPISTLTGKVIPPLSTVTVSASFVPPISGHYCVDVSYTITSVGAGADSGLALAAAGSSGRQQRNLDARPGGNSPPNDKNALKKADNSWKVVKKFAPRGTNVQVGLLDGWWSWAKDSAEKIAQSLGGDPPRQDYEQITLPISITVPQVLPGGSITQDRADALNETGALLATMVAYGKAAARALDRYAGATEANNQLWAVQQANARIEYEQQMGQALMAYADSLDALRQVLIDEAEPNVTITISDVVAYQAALQSTGFTAQEIADAHLLGLTDAEIDAYKAEIIATDPSEMAGSVLDKYEDEAAASRELGIALLTSDTFQPGFSISGGAGLTPATVVSNTLAQIDNTSATFVLGNPLTNTAAIELRPRRIDLPADWTISLSPGAVTLAPGEQTTVTVTVLTGSLAPQGTVPRVAVEAYAGSQLLGGVVVDIMVPAFTDRFATYNLFTPLVRR